MIRSFGLAAAGVIGFSALGVCQTTTDPTDFRLNVAYCLGTRTRMITEYEQNQHRDCVSGVNPDLCDSDTKTIAALQTEAARLRLYLFSKLEEGAGGLADVGATQRGVEDASALLDAVSSCGGARNFSACLESLRKINSTLAADEDRVRRCKQTLQMLPF